MVSPYSGTSCQNAPVHPPMKKKKTWSKSVEVVLGQVKRVIPRLSMKLSPKLLCHLVRNFMFSLEGDRDGEHTGWGQNDLAR